MADTIERKIELARARIATAEAEIKRLEAEADFCSSFNQIGTAHIVIRRSIDTGRLEGILAAFTESDEATRYAKGVPAYGLGKDIFIEDISLYGVKP